MDIALRAGAAIVAAVAAAWVLYPGWYSFDAAHQLQQAVQGRYSDLQPPAMALAWAGLLALGLPPGALLVVNLAAAVVGLALLGRALRGAWGATLPLLVLWPPFLVLFGHLWSDVALAALMLLAAGLLLGPSVGRTAPLAAMALLCVVVALRHNAAPAVLPLFVLALARWPGAPSRLTMRLALALPRVLVAVLAASTLSRAVTERPVPSWTPTAVWDLAAASVESGELLLPPGTHGPAMTVDELRAYMDHDMALGLWLRAPSGINVGIAAPLPPGTERELLRRWLALPLTHPRPWLSHRARVAWSLFGPQRADKPTELLIVPQVVALEGNPPIRANATAANRALVEGVLARKASIWIAPAGYLLLGVAASLLALRRGMPAPSRSAVLALAASGWLYAAPLALVAPSAEWRYAFWPMLACLVAFALAAFPCRRQAAPRADI